ncbi:MAG: hypothetical protein DRJ31_09435 [Candidatus Methanomethylicota archaeon]|uniref:Uncharacterized protein n=1 Tax=Thermoproteota archaeon TaxID=2056631 RepID=A0A497EKJ2_9CREN|nr:MAG: hypothetical protein DRJ31_09435 [Candidatus Verstraetearchaeota archaeon]
MFPEPLVFLETTVCSIVYKLSVNTGIGVDMSEIEIVKLQARKVKETTHYSITIPKDFVEKLG